MPQKSPGRGPVAPHRDCFDPISVARCRAAGSTNAYSLIAMVARKLHSCCRTSSFLQKEFGVEREFAVQCEANSQQSEFRPVASRSEQGSTINRSGKKVMHRGV